MNTYRNSERGQAMVFLVISIVVLLGFVALAIDGGMAYSDRRHSQNGADASSLAGGGAAALSLDNDAAAGRPGVGWEDWNCSSVYMGDAKYDAIRSAIDRAVSNGFPVSGDWRETCDGAFNCVDAVCGVQDNGGWVEKYIDVTTYISSTTQTSFMHIIFPGNLQNRVQAVTRVRPPFPFAYGNAVVSLNQSCAAGGGITIGGNEDVDIIGGGLFSNGCITKNGNGDVVIQPDDMRSVCAGGDECYTQNGNGPIEPHDPVPGAPPLPPGSYGIPAPDCQALYGNPQNQHTGGGTLNPGRYRGIRMTTNQNLTLNPGLYCISDDDFWVSNGFTFGENVTIFLEVGADNFHTTANARVELYGPPPEPCGDPCDLYHAIDGVLIYMAEGNHNEVTLIGGANTTFRGIVYAPTGDIKVTGTSDSAAFQTQLIGFNIDISGNAEFDIEFLEDQVKIKPAQIDLFR